MAKSIKPKGEEKHQGLLDKLIHGDHSQDEKSEAPEVKAGPKKSKKVSDEGASSESKHQHRKFDKFK